MSGQLSSDCNASDVPQLTLTPKLRADLRMLERFRPNGMKQANCGWSAHGRFLAKGRAAHLLALRYAWIDFSGWKPRIKIKLAGRHAIGATEHGSSAGGED
jgi:hypothetical protein